MREERERDRKREKERERDEEKERGGKRKFYFMNRFIFECRN